MLVTIVPVILCGGSGTRLWPLSRNGFSKQFLALAEAARLFQQAVERVNGLPASDRVVGETPFVPAADYAVQNVEASTMMVPLAAGWSDLGAWDSARKVGESGADVSVAHGDTLQIEAADTLIHATSYLVGTVGVSNPVNVETPDAVLGAGNARI